MPPSCLCLKPIIALLLDNTITVAKVVSDFWHQGDRVTRRAAIHMPRISLFLRLFHRAGCVRRNLFSRSRSPTLSERFAQTRKARKVGLSVNLFTFAKSSFMDPWSPRGSLITRGVLDSALIDLPLHGSG